MCPITWALFGSFHGMNYVMRKFSLSLILFLSCNAWANLSDFFMDHREPGFLYYCDVGSEDYDKDQCHKNHNKSYTQDIVRIYRDKDRIGVEVLIHWGKGRVSGSTAYGHYNKQKNLIKLDSFMDDEWANPNSLNEEGAYKHPCEILVTKQANFVAFKKIPKPGCELPSSFEMLLKSSMCKHIGLRSTERCVIKLRSA